MEKERIPPREPLPRGDRRLETRPARAESAGRPRGRHARRRRSRPRASSLRLSGAHTHDPRPCARSTRPRLPRTPRRSSGVPVGTVMSRLARARERWIALAGRTTYEPGVAGAPREASEGRPEVCERFTNSIPTRKRSTPTPASAPAVPAIASRLGGARWRTPRRRGLRRGRLAERHAHPSLRNSCREFERRPARGSRARSSRGARASAAPIWDERPSRNLFWARASRDEAAPHSRGFAAKNHPSRAPPIRRPAGRHGGPPRGGRTQSRPGPASPGSPPSTRAPRPAAASSVERALATNLVGEPRDRPASPACSTQPELRAPRPSRSREGGRSNDAAKALISWLLAGCARSREPGLVLPSEARRRRRRWSCRPVHRVDRRLWASRLSNNARTSLQAAAPPPRSPGPRTACGGSPSSAIARPASSLRLLAQSVKVLLRARARPARLAGRGGEAARRKRSVPCAESVIEGAGASSIRPSRRRS
jgi:hypothetical protein